MKKVCLIFSVMMLTAAACSQHPVVSDPETPLPEDSPMVISVKSGGDTDPEFTFLFWHQDDFNRGLRDEAGSPVMPYHVANPTGQIGDYEESAGTTEAGGGQTDYNTGRVYPADYGIAVCTGFAPYDKVMPSKDNDGSQNYFTLSVADGGYTDVMVSQNYLEGSSISPFYGNLEFFHPQIHIEVNAKLAENMAKYIKDVSLAISGDNIISSLEWNSQLKQYRPTDERSSSSWTSGVMSEYLNKSETKDLGKVLVVPAPEAENWLMKSLDLTVSGKIANTDSEVGSDFSMNVTADFSELDGGGLALGDSYIISLSFDEDQIEITAVKVPWEEGGNVLAPIHPIPPESV